MGRVKLAVKAMKKSISVHPDMDAYIRQIGKGSFSRGMHYLVHFHQNVIAAVDMPLKKTVSAKVKDLNQE